MQKNANETAKETKNMFLQSAKELKAVTTLAACAMFAALAMILNQVASIDIGPYVRIGFSGPENRSHASVTRSNSPRMRPYRARPVWSFG